MGQKHTEQLYNIIRDPLQVPMFIVEEQTLENLALLELCKVNIEIVDALCSGKVLILDHMLIIATQFKHNMNAVLRHTSSRSKVAAVFNYAHKSLEVALEYALQHELYEIAHNIKFFNELLERDTDK